MKLSFTFQALILVAIASALAFVTAFWGVYVYRSVYDTILAGFDRKLLALSVGASSFVDGDAHELYQRRRKVVALASQPGSALLGADTALGELVAIDLKKGSAQPLAPLPGGAVRALVMPPGSLRALALAGDDSSLVELDVATGAAGRTIALGRALDGLFVSGKRLLGWRERELFAVDAVSGALTPLGVSLPEPLLSLTAAPGAQEWIGLTADRASLVVLDARGALLRKLALYSLAEALAGTAPAEKKEPERMPPPALDTLAFHGSQLYGAGVALAKIDPQTGLVARGDFTLGFFDVDLPFYQQHRAAMIALQQDTGLSYLYTQVYLGGKKIYYVMDGTVGDGYSPPGSGDDLPDSSVEGAEWVQSLGRSWMSPIQQWEMWGLLKSCFTPVYNSSGKIIAMAGADVNITIIRHKTRWALFGVVFVGVGTVVLAGFISFGVARSLTRPLRQIKDSALWIAAGYYRTRVSAPGTREMSGLAHALNALATHVTEEEARVTEYRQQLELRRRGAVLQTALRDVAEPAAPAEGDASPFALSPLAGAVTVGPRAVLWLAEPDENPVTAICQRARAACLARALLAERPSLAPENVIELLCASMPALTACAVWTAATRTLHISSRQPLRLTSAEGEPISIEAGVSVVTIPADRGWQWAETENGNACAATREAQFAVEPA